MGYTFSMQTHATGRFAHPALNTDALGIHEGMVVADFGVGSGQYALHIAERVGRSGVVYAIDVQQPLLVRLKNESHRKGLDTIHIVWGDVTRVGGSKIADGVVDRVLISNLLFQLEEPIQALKEARRILKPAGQLALIDWSDAPPSSGRRWGPHTSHRIKKDQALVLARKAHFESVREFNAGAHHYGLIFRPAPKTAL